MIKSVCYVLFVDWCTRGPTPNPTRSPAIHTVIALNFEQKIADLTRLADELRRINGERGRADRFLKVRPEVLQSAAKPCQPARGHCHVASGLAVQ
jgi:hypothetical protein